MIATTVAGLIDAARERLRGLPQERLGQWAQNRRVLGFGRAPRILPVASAWHLGVLLLGEDELWATGQIVRAREEAVRGFTAESQRERAELSYAAFRGGFAAAEVVHLDWTPLDPGAVDHGAESGPLSLRDGVPHIRWSAAAPTRSLVDYLAEHLDALAPLPPADEST